jgi:N-acetylglutamate synthase-like GNAT family acetyltransferase
MACTPAGGVAACAGYSEIDDDTMILHSLAVAPPSRGSGIGASLLAQTIGEHMDDDPVVEIYLCTDRARSFFASFGFRVVDRQACPDAVLQHPSFTGPPGSESHAMLRRYDRPERRGLDRCAYRLIHNTTQDATLPPGSVFLFTQQGPVLQANYRGGPVVRGHLLGSIENESIAFCWHHYTEERGLMWGDGQIFIERLDDGRHELREMLSDVPEDDPGELLLREV